MRHLEKTKLSLLVFLFGFMLTAQTSSKLYSSGVMIRANETVKTYNITSNDAGGFTAQQNAIAQDGNQWNSPELLFDGQKLGSFEQSKGSILLDGFEIRTKKDKSLQNICRPIAYYSIIPEAATTQEAVYTQLTIPYKSTCNNGEYGDGNGPCDGEDIKNVWQKWSTSSLDIDLTNLTPGNYNLAIYFQLNGNNNGTSGCETLEYINNEDKNFVASFTITPEVKETYAYAAGIETHQGYPQPYNLFSTEKGEFSDRENAVHEFETLDKFISEVYLYSMEKNSSNLGLMNLEIRTKKSHSGQNICRPFAYLKIVNLDNGSETLEQFQIPYKATCDQGTFADGSGVCDGDDDKNIWQKWVIDLNKDLTQLNIGNYRAEMYFEIYGNENGTSGCDQLLQTIDNDGEMYRFLFEITPEIKNISLVGSAAKGWKTDIPMESTDGVNFSLKGYELIDGGVKFRQDGNWDTNWGSTDYPTGTGTQNGKNIPVKAGKYDITLNIKTGVYSFDKTKEFTVISLIGEGALGMDKDIHMTTEDGINYTLEAFDFRGGGVKFRANNNWDDNWGGDKFPSGTAQRGAQVNIPVASGNYNVSFNIETLEYSFVTVEEEFPVISIIGSAAQGWDTDVEMTTITGTIYTIENLTLVAGEFKFRQDKNWTIHWGGTSFPEGTAVKNEVSNIKVLSPGTYNVLFNMSSGEYIFIDTTRRISLIGSAVGGWDLDLEMTTEDDINYSVNNVTLQVGEVLFRKDKNWNFQWGGDALSGTAIPNGNHIVIEEAGDYNVSFNTDTLAYSFEKIENKFTVVSLIGEGVTDWATDLDMTTTDGILYTAQEVNFIGGEVKFRANNAWDKVWGGDALSGIAIEGGDNIFVVPGNYNVSFNIETLEYSFVAVEEEFPVISIIGQAVGGWNYDVVLETVDGIHYYGSSIRFSFYGFKFRQDKDWQIYWGGTGFPEGIAEKDFNSNILVSVAGIYNVSFNRITGEYSFIETTRRMSLIGSAVGGWDVDLEMTTEDDINYSVNNVTLQKGEVLFRKDKNWNFQWGGDALSGTAIPNGNHIVIEETGDYNVSFNTETLEYSFTLVEKVQRTLSNNYLNDNLEKEVTYSPNPFQNVLNLSGVDLGNEVIINFYTLAGNLVHTIYNPTSNELDVAHLPNGMYIVHTTVNGETTIKKLIKE